MTVETAIAVNRFGLGARLDEALPAEPRRWLRDQMAAFVPRPAALASVPTSAAMAEQYHGFLIAIRDKLGPMGIPALAGLPPLARGAPPAGAMPAPPAAAADAGAAKTPQMELRQLIGRGYRASYLALAQGRLGAALVSPAPFAERLTHFWANHFADFGRQARDRSGSPGPSNSRRSARTCSAASPTCCSRSNATRRCCSTSTKRSRSAPRRPSGTRRRCAAMRRARSGSTRTSRARSWSSTRSASVPAIPRPTSRSSPAALTGWSVGGFVRRGIGTEAPDGAFVFQTDWHEPGTRTLLGVRYPDNGEQQAATMLRALAVHPATAHHLATKLARHFVADDPPPALVERLAAVHVASGGNLTTVYETLIDAPEAWAVPLAKFKTPWDWTVSALRGVGARTADAKAVGALTALGQPIWKPGSPAGWDDVGPSWAAPDALYRRVEVAQRVATAVPAVDARTLGPRLMPGTWSPATAAAVAKADLPAQGLAMLLVAPEFMRR